MGVINILDKHVAELIAAGEVVERPASAIKELIENSIDAGASNITVEIKNGGTTFIRVNDDGCGIMKDDVKNAFLRHATSKVKKETDLDSISTLGFRGEALASISAVSKLRLITRHKDEQTGTCYEIDGGEEVSFSEAGCPVGTTFIIRDLFYNVPARMKFLKKDVSEGNAVSSVLDKSALSHPEIAFNYIKDGKQALRTSGDGKLKSAVYSVFGREFAIGMIPVDYCLNGIKVRGYISKPSQARPNRNLQNFFINGRYVKTKTASAALEEAFKGSIMVGKFPSCVLHLEMSFEAIDVNVHPAKVEVRFLNERPVFDAVYHGVKSSLLSYDSKKNIVLNKPASVYDVAAKKPFTVHNPILKNSSLKNNSPVGVNVENHKRINNKIDCNPFDELDLPDNNADKISKIGKINQSIPKNSAFISDNECGNPVKNKNRGSDNIGASNVNENQAEIKGYFEFLDETNALNTKTSQSDSNIKCGSRDNSYDNSVVGIYKNTDRLQDNKEYADDSIKPIINIDEPVFRYIGEAFKTYIIIEKNNKELLFIDKHAAHERIIYEKLKKEKGAGFSQILLKPITVTLSMEEYNAAVNNLDMFKECAFDAEDFGNGVLIIRSAPSYLDESDIADSVMEMAQHIAENKKDIRSEKMDWIYHNVACRAAIKARNDSTDKELIDIAKIVDSDPNIRYCPHGRPTCIVISKYEIEKNFGRV